MLGYDIYNTPYRIVAVQYGTCSSYDLDPFDGFKRYLNRVGTGVVYQIYLAVIDQNQNVAVGRTSEAPNVYCFCFCCAVIINVYSESLLKQFAFADHHDYRPSDYRRIASWSAQADYIITTEKDIVKINQNMLDKEKLLVLRIAEKIDEEECFFDLLTERLDIR